MLRAGKLRIKKKISELNKDKENLKQLIDDFVFKTEAPALELLKDAEQETFCRYYRIISESLENCSEKLFLLSSALLEEAEKKNHLKILPSSSLESLSSVRVEEDVIQPLSDAEHSEIIGLESENSFSSDQQLQALNISNETGASVVSYNENEHLLDSPNIWCHQFSFKGVAPLEIMEASVSKICIENISLDESTTLIDLDDDNDENLEEKVHASSTSSSGRDSRNNNLVELNCDDDNKSVEFSQFSSEEIEINYNFVNETKSSDILLSRQELKGQVNSNFYLQKENLENTHTEMKPPSNEPKFAEELAQYCASHFSASSSNSSFFSVCTSPQRLSSASSLHSMLEEQQSPPSQIARNEEKSEAISCSGVRNSSTFNTTAPDDDSIIYSQPQRTLYSTDKSNFHRDKCAIYDEQNVFRLTSDQELGKQDERINYDSIHIDTGMDMISKNHVSPNCKTEDTKDVYPSTLISHNNYKDDSNSLELGENESLGLQTDGGICHPCVKLRTHIKTIVCHVVNPSDFWIQPDIEQFHELTQVLVPLHQGDEDLLPEFNTDKGKICLVPYFTDGNYYRALITDVLSADCDSEPSVQVFYFDYGDTAVVPSACVKCLPEGLSSFPAQAIHCCLHNVTSYDDTWSEDAIEAFQQAVLSPYLHAFIHPVGEDSIYPVNLTVKFFLQKEINSYDIADILCYRNLAKKWNIADEPNSEISQPKHESVEQSSNYSSEMVTSSKEICKKNIKTEEKNTDLNGASLSSEESSNSITPSNTGTKCSTFLNAETCNSDECTLINEESMSSLTISKEKFVLNNCNKTVDEDSNTNDKASDDFNVNEKFSSFKTDCSKNSFNLNYVNYTGAGNGFECTDILPSKEIEISGVLLVLCLETISPGEFYVNIAEHNSDEYDHLHKEMNLFYTKNYKFVSVSKEDIQIGSLWCCRFSKDDAWYRVKVLKMWDIDTSETQTGKAEYPPTKLLVYFVDFGDKQIIYISELQPLDKEFMKLPAFAILCTLAHLYPNSVENTYTNDNTILWPENSVNRFQEIVDSEKYLVAKVVLPDDSKNQKFITLNDTKPLSVLLWVIRDDKEMLVNALLAAEGLAGTQIKSWLNESQEMKEENEQLSLWNPMEEVFFSERNSYAVDTDDPEIATVGYKNVDEQYICKFFSSGHCWRKSCPYLHIQSDERTSTEDELYSTLSSLELPDVGTKVVVQITSAYNPTHFYSIFPYGTSPVDQLNCDPGSYDNSQSLDDECLEALQHSINEFYANLPYNEDSTVALALGKTVVAKSEIFDQWCRARVLDVDDSEQPIELFFLDFGTCEKVKRRYIRQIEPQFLFLPIQAVECFIPNLYPVECKEGIWSEEIIIAFRTIIENKMLIAHILQKNEDDSLKVELFVLLEDNFIPLSRYLVSNGMAYCDDSCHSQLVRTS